MIREKTQKSEIIIDLTGPDGNAYALLGYASEFGKQLDLTETHIQNILDEMRLSDYENLVSVFDREFGHFVILER